MNKNELKSIQVSCSLDLNSVQYNLHQSRSIILDLSSSKYNCPTKSYDSSNFRLVEEFKGIKKIIPSNFREEECYYVPCQTLPKLVHGRVYISSCSFKSFQLILSYF